MNSVLRTPNSRILLQDIWWTADGGPSLTEEIIGRLAPYVTRYAHTLGISVLAVGGAEDHLHILYDMAPNRTPDEVTAELQKTTTRFLREVLGARWFAWAEASCVESFGADDIESLTEYVAENFARHHEDRVIAEYEGAKEEDSDEGEVPEWLRDALSGRES
jgi:REP element-mobilizing transposase RayT